LYVKEYERSKRLTKEVPRLSALRRVNTILELVIVEMPGGELANHRMHTILGLEHQGWIPILHHSRKQALLVLE
jgi:hypothetical protein